MNDQSDQRQGTMVHLPKHDHIIDLYKTVSNGREQKTFPANYQVGDAILLPDRDNVVIGKPGVFLLNSEPDMICSTSIVPLSKVCNANNDTEWLVELYYIDANGEPQSFTVERKVLATKSKVIDLTARGIDISDNNAAKMVTYFQAVLNSKFPEIRTGSDIAGWINDNSTFAIYDNNVIVFDNEYRNAVRALQAQKGTITEWQNAWRNIRANSIELRLAMAACFASPLVALLNVQPFILHLYAKTGHGKTTILQAATTIYGNADRTAGYFSSLNTTPAALMDRASYLHDLPLIIDEMQVNLTAHKGDKSDFDNLVYCLTEGQNKQRCDTSGSINTNSAKTWNCVVLTTGEQPLTNEKSPAGVKNRTIEIEIQDFDIAKETGVSFADIHKTIQRYYGTAGRYWIERLTQSETLRDSISTYYADMTENLRKENASGKQAAAMALLLTADKFANDELFAGTAELSINDVKPFFKTERDIDATREAYERITEYIAANAVSFKEDNQTFNSAGRKGELRLETADGKTYAVPAKGEPPKDARLYCYMFAKQFSETMEQFGYNKNTIARDMANAGYIVADANGKPKRPFRTKIDGVYTVIKAIKIPMPAEQD